MSHPTIESKARKARVAEWYAQKQKLGTMKTLAHELGMTLKGVEGIVNRLRNPAPARGCQ
jgi:hypothetical protein